MSKPRTDWSTVLTVPARPGNGVDYLIDGPDTFKAMHDAIGTAFPYPDCSGYYIYLLGWWLDDLIPLTGKPGSSVAALFREASLRKVQIRAMLWDQAWPPTKNTKEVERINSLPTGAAILDNNTLFTVGSHHQKVLIVNGLRGLIGFCGGVDINKDRIETTSDQLGSPMHDVHCRIEGEAVRDLLDVFVQRWRAHPKHEELDKNKGPLIGLNAAGGARPDSKPRGEQAVGIARTFNFVGNGKKCAKEHSIRTTMLAAIKAAKRFVYIEDQYLVCMEAAEALRSVISRLQHVTVVIPHSSITEPGMPHVWEKRAAFIFTMQAAPGGQRKARVFYRISPNGTFGPRTYIHAKTWIIDDELAVIGSANCNRRGWSSDSEVIAAIYDREASVKAPSFAQRLRVELWARNLGLSAAQRTMIADGVEGAAIWDRLPSSAIVRRYDPRSGEDTLKLDVPWSAIDPSAVDLSSCGTDTTTAR